MEEDILVIPERELENSRQPINRLPFEVLSRIFVLCRANKDRKRGCPDLFRVTVLPSICRYWRNAAFETKALWSLVTLSERPPFHFSALCLDRSGTTSPLDIEFELTSRLWRHIPDCKLDTRVKAVHGALTFIIAHGGVASRWRSLWLRTPGGQVKELDLHIAALKIIGTFPMPSLQYVELKCSVHDDNGKGQIRISSLPPKPLFCDPAPIRLRVAKLEWVPSSYLFANPNHLQLVSLSHLEIRFPADLPQLEHMHTLLCASPMLEVLLLDLRATRPHSPVDLIHLPRINFPGLRALGLSVNSRIRTPRWGHNLLLMIDAPNVESLQFQLEYSGADASQDRELIDYITRGANPVSPRPLFPSVTGLELSIDQDYTRLFEQFLAAYSQITILSLPRPTHAQLEALPIQPWLVPDLSYLIVYASPNSPLKAIVAERCSAGLPLKEVLVEMRPMPTSLIGRAESRIQEQLQGLGARIALSRSKNRARKVLGFVEDWDAVDMLEYKSRTRLYRLCHRNIGFVKR